MALAVASLLFVSGYYLNISISKSVVIFAFLGTLCCYNFIKYGVEIDKYSERDSLGIKIIGLLSISSLLASLYLLFQFNTVSWILLGVLLLLILLYIIPIFPNERNLRSLGLIKVFLVALIWTGMTVTLPVLEGGFILNWDVLVLATQRFFLVVALMIPFEIRDVQFDPPEIITIPKRIGIKRTKFLGISLLVISYFMVFLKDSIYSDEIITRLWFTIIAIILIAMTPEKGSKYYAAFWVEALPLIWLGTLYISNIMN